MPPRPEPFSWGSDTGDVDPVRVSVSSAVDQLRGVGRLHTVCVICSHDIAAGDRGKTDTGGHEAHRMIAVNAATMPVPASTPETILARVPGIHEAVSLTICTASGGMMTRSRIAGHRTTRVADESADACSEHRTGGSGEHRCRQDLRQIGSRNHERVVRWRSTRSRPSQR
jgi:hypothetical protein